MNDLMDENQAAEWLNVSPRTLQAWRYASNAVMGPQYIKVGRAVRYQLDDLKAWTEERKND